MRISSTDKEEMDMTKRVEEALKMMLVANLRYFADNTNNEDEQVFMEALADEIEGGTASEDQIIEAIEIVSPESF